MKTSTQYDKECLTNCLQAKGKTKHRKRPQRRMYRSKGKGNRGATSFSLQRTCYVCMIYRFRSVHPTLRRTRPTKVNLKKCDGKIGCIIFISRESSVSQPRAVGFCWNLVSGCIVCPQKRKKLNPLPIKHKMADGSRIFNVYIAVKFVTSLQIVRLRQKFGRPIIWVRYESTEAAQWL